jgi:mannose-6-phosphate isomerase-like protein (cupin superfamily)
MAGGVLTNPITKERFVRLPAPPDRLRIEVQAPPDMVRPPLHLHRHSAESFQILDGRATLLVDGVERVLRQADSLEAAPGTPHTWWNSGDGPLRFVTEFRPALRMQSFFETLCGLAAEGRKPDFMQIAASAPLWDTYLAHRLWCSARFLPSFGRLPGRAATGRAMRASTVPSVSRRSLPNAPSDAAGRTAQ